MKSRLKDYGRDNPSYIQHKGLSHLNEPTLYSPVQSTVVAKKMTSKGEQQKPLG
jgi:hypothetical protein